MTAKFEPRDWMAALGQLKDASEQARKDTPRAPVAPSREERQNHEQLKLKVIEARVKLKLMRDRTEALKEALERYRQRESNRA